MMMEQAKRDVLLVDDDEAIRESLAMFLTSSGYHVRLANGGFSALTQMAEALPALVISDLNMPQMSGYELLSVIRQGFPQVLRIAMSGAHRGPLVPAGVAAHAFFGKGQDVNLLLKIVETLTGDQSVIPAENELVMLPAA
jgi:CheY-like chemotaxis protein